MAKEKSSSVQLRRFGLTVASGLALAGGLSWYRGHTYVPAVLWTIAAPLLLLSLTTPGLLRPFERCWSGLAMVLAWVNTRIILSLLFYGVLAPVGVIMGFFRDPLDRRLHDGRASYWVTRERKPFDPKAYENQF